MVIYLGPSSPMSSCGFIKAERAAPLLLSNLASGGVYRATDVTTSAVSSYLTFPSLPA